LGKLASSAGKFAKIGGGLLAVGTAAYEGYNEYQEADEKVKSGEITKEEGQVKKGEAVGGGVGGAGGALAGAAAGAAIGSVVPVVGTAIGGLVGGAIGYWGGKKAGQAVGGTAVKGYQAIGGNNPNSGAMENVDAMGNPTGGGDSSAPATNSTDPKKDKLARDWAWSVMTEQNKESEIPAQIKDQVTTVIKNDDVLKQQAKKYLEDKKAGAQKVDKAQQVAKVQQSKPEQIKPETSNVLAQKTGEVEEAKAASQTNSNVVNAPQSSVTNITNNNGGGKESSKPSARNEDSTYQRYLDRRYYPMRDF
jgi:hypothetical protein